MEKWGVEQDDLHTEERVIFDRFYHRCPGSKQVKWQGQLAMVICDLLGSIKCHAHGAYTPAITFYGPSRDALDAKDLFAEWVNVITALGLQKYGGSKRGAGRSYCEGYVAGLRSKVRKIELLERGEVGERALVVQRTNLRCQELREEAEAWLAAQGTKLSSRKAGGGGNHDPGAFQHGRQDGQSAHFTRTVTRKLS